MVTADAGPTGREHRYLWGLAASVGLAAVVVLREVNVLSDQVVAPSTGYTWPLDTLFGPDRAAASRGWRELTDDHVITPGSVYGRVLTAHLVADVLFITAYAAVLYRLATHTFRSRVGKVCARAALVALVVSDLVEDLLAAGRIEGGGPPLWCLTGVTRAKWVCCLVIVLAVLVRALMPRRGRRRPAFVDPLRRAARAMLHHRFSVALVVPLFVLSVLPGHPILEQLPDVQRAWVSNGNEGYVHAAAAAFFLGGAALLAELFGRYRTGYARRHERGLPVVAPPDLESLPPKEARFARRQQHSMLLLWLIGPAIALVGAAGATAAVPEAQVLGIRLGVFCAVPLIVAAVSWVLRLTWEICPCWLRPDRPPRYTKPDLSAIAFTGHAVPLALLSVGGLGLLRSFTSMGLLVGDTAKPHGSVVAFLALGGLLAVLPWCLAWLLSGDNDRTALARRIPQFENASPRSWPRWLLLGGVITGLIAVGVFPVTLGTSLGVSAMAILSISLVVSLPAVAGLLVQERPTAEIFRLFGFRRTPLITVLVLTIALIGLSSGQGSINLITPGDGKHVDQDNRPIFDDVVSAWSKDQRACTVMVGNQAVRPMLLVAAEGGGIRAAYWTVLALQRLAESSPKQGTDAAAVRDGCASYSTLMSAGASGGSVGLTVARFSGSPDDPGLARAVTTVQGMAAPDTLAAAVAGTFVRDPLYAATGVPLGGDGTVPAGAWADRGRLIELGWETAIHRAGDASPAHFLDDPTQLSPSTGQLILNSSSVLNQCRVWVSQVQFADSSDAGAGRGEQGCGQVRAPAPRTIDLFSAYGPFGPAPKGSASCLGRIEMTTAALLTARFPYVTPGGVVGDCPFVPGAGDEQSGYWPRTQLVDGGYLENTGLATLTDLAPQWTAQVRQYNEQALANRRAIIVPIIVYLTNGSADVAHPPARRRPANELLVPPLTILGGTASLAKTDALLPRADAAVDVRSFCPATEGSALEVCERVDSALPRRVVVVDRAAQPEVSAPLGWTMSAASRQSLHDAIVTQQNTRCLADSDQARTAPVCRRGYAALGDLQEYLKR